MQRKDFVALLEQHGGQVKSSVSKEVTHLICSDPNTAKARKAVENGIQVCSEEAVLALIDAVPRGNSTSATTTTTTKKAQSKKKIQGETVEAKASRTKNSVSSSTSTSRAFADMIFCITGKLSMQRKDFVELLEKHGGQVKSSVTNDVTHLICSDPNTAKARKASEKGIEVLSEDCLLARLLGGGGKSEKNVAEQELEGEKSSDEEEKPQDDEEESTQSKEVISMDIDDDEDEEGAFEEEVQQQQPEEVGSLSVALYGLIFCITGKLSMVRKEFEALLVENGAQLRSTVTGDVTHLISADSTTAKAKKAKAKGIEIVTEEAVTAMIARKPAPCPKKRQRDNPTRMGATSTISPQEEQLAKKARTKRATAADIEPSLSLADHVFCITGTLSAPRKAIEDMLRANGAQVKSTVTSSVTHLICNDHSTSKADKARKLNIQIVTEEWVNTITGGVSAEKKTVAKYPFDDDDNNDNNRRPLQPATGKDIADGESVEVVGSSGGTPYTLKNTGGVYSCTCPGWRFQSKQIDTRTCKHLRNYRGDAAEKARLGNDYSNGKSSSSSSPAKKASTNLRGGAFVEP